MSRLVRREAAHSAEQFAPIPLSLGRGVRGEGLSSGWQVRRAMIQCVRVYSCTLVLRCAAATHPPRGTMMAIFIRRLSLLALAGTLVMAGFWRVGTRGNVLAQG